MSAKRQPFIVVVSEELERVKHASGRNAAAVHLDRILDELGMLRMLMGRAEESEASGKALWEGLEAIQEAIQQTRGEIASLHANGVDGQRLNRATDELDAVVSDTEGATESILSAAESIEKLSGLLMRDGSADQVERLSEIQAHSIGIFEACNFQDITGQRIRKVVHLLQFIEGRIATMMDIWGRIERLERATGDPGVERRPVEPDKALLNGPALAGDFGVVSQDDIDSLFA